MRPVDDDYLSASERPVIVVSDTCGFLVGDIREESTRIGISNWREKMNEATRVARSLLVR